MIKTIKEGSSNQINKKIILKQCPVTYTLGKIGGRWKPIILWNLKTGKKRYGELRKLIPPISEKMLIQQLKEMEADGLVIRKALPIIPPHVEYSLSPKGKAIGPLLQEMANWGIKYQ